MTHVWYISPIFCSFFWSNVDEYKSRDIGATFLQQIPPAARLLTQLRLRSHHWWPCQLQQRRLSPSPKRSRPPWLRQRPRRGRTGWNGWNGWNGWVVQDVTPWKSWMDGTSQKWRFGSDDNLRLSSAQVIFGGGFARRFIFWGVLEERLLSVLGHWKRKDKGEVLVVIIAGSFDLFSLVSTLQEMITYPNSQLMKRKYHLQNCLFRGYVSSKEGKLMNYSNVRCQKEHLLSTFFCSSLHLNFQLYKKYLTVRGNYFTKNEKINLMEYSRRSPCHGDFWRGRVHDLIPSLTCFFSTTICFPILGFGHLSNRAKSVKTFGSDHTVDGSEIPNNHLGWCRNPMNSGIFSSSLVVQDFGTHQQYVNKKILPAFASGSSPEGSDSIKNRFATLTARDWRGLVVGLRDPETRIDGQN